MRFLRYREEAMEALFVAVVIMTVLPLINLFKRLYEGVDPVEAFTIWALVTVGSYLAVALILWVVSIVYNIYEERRYNRWR